MPTSHFTPQCDEFNPAPYKCPFPNSSVDPNLEAAFGRRLGNGLNC